jgi:ABC-2 family transporter protein
VKMVALLKDSAREALDRKIFAAMLVLSGLLTLFVVSVSFRRITVEDELQAVAGQLTWGLSFNPLLGQPTYAVEDFQQTNPAAEPWHGDYRFEWVVRAKDADKLKQLPMVRLKEVRHLMRDGLKYLDNVEVADNSSRDPKEARFAVTTHGTKVEDPLAWRYEPIVLFAVPLPFLHTSLREGVYFIENTLVGGLGAWVAVLVGVIVTSSFIPNMLEKGAVELILAKPVRRPGLLVYKYLGGLVFVLLLTAATVLGVWTAIGVRTGVWATGFLLVIPAVTFYFALLYAVSTLAAVVTRSPVVAILMTCAVWFGLWLNGAVHGALDGVRKARTEAETQIRKLSGSPNGDEKAKDDEEEGRRGPPQFNVPRWVYAVSDFTYRVLPRTGDLNRLTDEWVARGVLTESEVKARGLDKVERPHWGEVFGVTGAFIALVLGAACWWFTRADY